MTSDDIAPLLGAAREGIAAIENLGQLLGSSRVSARKIGGALPSVREACEELVVRLARLESRLESTLSPSAFAAAAAVIADSRETVVLLTGELAAVGDRVSTGARIQLERQAKAAGAKLGTARALLELFGAETVRGAVPVDLAEILREQWSAAAVGPSLGVELALGADCGLHAEPRLIGALIELALAVVAARAASAVLRITSARRPDGRLVIHIAASSGGAATLTAPHRAAVPPLADALVEAARRLGAELELGRDGAEVTLPVTPEDGERHPGAP
jgi:hypothetical protein